MSARTTADQKQRFLAAIRRGATVTTAAQHARVDRTLPYVWQRADPHFAAAWAAAREDRLTQLKDTAFDLALGGSEPMIRYLLNRYETLENKEAAIHQVEIIMPGGPTDDRHDFFTVG